MSKSFNNFATPDWESTSFGEEMCKNLFKGHERSSNKLKKKTSIPISKIQKSDRVKKAKTKKKQISSNDAILKNVGKSLMKVKKLVNPNRKESKIAPIKVAHVGQTADRNITQKIKHLSQPKHLAYAVRKNLKRKNDPEMKSFLLSSTDNSMSEVNIWKTNNALIVPRKNKQKLKKLETLKKSIDNKLQTDMKERKGNLKEYNRKSQIVNGLSKNFNKASEFIRKKSKPVPNSILDDVSLFGNTSKVSRRNKKCMSLRERMVGKLKASRFRYLNEEIYSMNSQDAQKMFADDPESFKAYHEGYRLQVNSWPINPVDVIISKIKTMPKSYVIADFGCGDAKLSEEVSQKVHSFDLVATNERVIACDMANVPLKKSTVDVVVFCLSLMGTNIHDYLKEANRVLKVGGLLKIAEVESRFDDVDNFIEGVQRFGYQNIFKDSSHDIFHFLDFKKTSNIKKNRILPTLSLQPCVYKKR